MVWQIAMGIILATVLMSLMPFVIGLIVVVFAWVVSLFK